MTTKSKCYEYAQANNLKIEDWGDTITIEDPPRMWDSEMHERVLDFGWGRSGAWREVAKEMRWMNKIQQPCVDVACEWCNS